MTKFHATRQLHAYAQNVTKALDIILLYNNEKK